VNFLGEGVAVSLPGEAANSLLQTNATLQERVFTALATHGRLNDEEQGVGCGGCGEAREQEVESEGRGAFYTYLLSHLRLPYACAKRTPFSDP
jgi:hypothetical protein